MSSLEDFTGPRRIPHVLESAIQDARDRQEALDHVLLCRCSPSYASKLALDVANELGVHIRITSEDEVASPGDLGALLTNLQPGDVLFISNIHRLSSLVKEVVYPAMEDFSLDIVIGKGPSARSVRLDLPPFTLIAFTPIDELLSDLPRSQFRINLDLDYEELCFDIRHKASELGIGVDDDAVRVIAENSRHSRSLAKTLVTQIFEIAQVRRSITISSQLTHDVINTLSQSALPENGAEDLKIMLREVMSEILDNRRRQDYIESQLDTIQKDIADLKRG